MEEYKILTNLPKDYIFGPLDKKDVRAFGKWFMAEKENRMQMLFDEVHRDPEFVDWRPDFTVESLKPLSNWFEKNIKSEPTPEDEYQEIMRQHEIKYHGEMGEESKAMFRKRITKKSRSLVFDVSIYLGEILLRELGDRQWVQYINVSKYNIDYGYMAIPTFIPKVVIAPWRVMVVLGARVIYSHTFEGEKLYKIAVQELDSLRNYYPQRLKELEKKKKELEKKKSEKKA